MSRQDKARAQARKAEIIAALDSLNATELLTVCQTIERVKQDDKPAVHQITARIKADADELEQMLMEGFTPGQFDQLITEGLKANGGEV